MKILTVRTDRWRTEIAQDARSCNRSSLTHAEPLVSVLDELWSCEGKMPSRQPAGRRRY